MKPSTFTDNCYHSWYLIGDTIFRSRLIPKPEYRVIFKCSNCNTFRVLDSEGAVCFHWADEKLLKDTYGAINVY